MNMMRACVSDDGVACMGWKSVRATAELTVEESISRRRRGKI